jgi:DNA-binding response OmpR family regulator
MNKASFIKRALVIDDDPMIRGLVDAILKAEGFEVVQAENGADGIKVLDTEARPLNFGVIFLDVMMPGMSGLDVLTRIRLHSHTSKIPVIMLTAEDKTKDIMDGYTFGADLYITKPFTRQQITSGIKTVLEGEG